MPHNPFHILRNNMEYLTHFLIILGFFSLFLTYGFQRTRASSRKSRRVEAPKPPGAWPLIGHLHLLRGQDPLARTLGAMADKYGSIYSLQLGSHGALVVSSWEMVKECFTINDRNFATRPSMAVGKYLGYDNAMFALAPYGQYWRDIRKMVTLELLTNHRLEKLKHVRASEVDYFIKDLHQLCAKNDGLLTKVTLNKWLENMTFNISIRMLAGKRFSASTGDKRSNEEWHFKEAIKKTLYLLGVFVISDSIPSLEWIDIGGYVKSMKQTAKEVDKIIGKWLEEHLQKIELRGTKCEGDFMDVMLSSLAEETTMCGHKRDTIIKSTTQVRTSPAISRQQRAYLKLVLVDQPGLDKVTVVLGT